VFPFYVKLWQRDSDKDRLFIIPVSSYLNTEFHSSAGAAVFDEAWSALRLLPVSRDPDFLLH
jgi:hypothetical protein